MRYDSQLFCINYNNSEYITDLADTITANLKRIMDFFEIEGFKERKVINIWDDLEDYRNYLHPYVKEYQDWMVADTFDNNINILSYQLFLTGPHKNSDLSKYKNIIIHELVHTCQQEINPNADNVVWFWEALATNLSEQAFQLIDLTYTKNDITNNYHKLTDAYSVSFTLGQYLLKNRPKSDILEYVKNPELLIRDTDTILESARKWLKSDNRL